MRTMGSMVAILMLVCACSPVVMHPVLFNDQALQSPGMKSEEYRIQATDQLDVKFFSHMELNEQVTVRPDGKISLQLVQEVQAAGLTPAELTDKLVKAYSVELEKPRITVIVRTFNAHKVYVDGEVYKAGLVTMAGPMTLMQSISLGGGLKDTAKTDEVIIIRRLADNRLVPVVTNLEKVINGTDLSQDIALRPNDIVFVPKSHIANVNVWIDQYLRRNIPVPIGFGYGL